MTIAQEIQGWRAWPVAMTYSAHGQPLYDWLASPTDPALSAQRWGYIPGRYRLSFFRMVDGIGQRLLDTRQTWVDYREVTQAAMQLVDVNEPYATVAARFKERADFYGLDQREAAAALTASLIAHRRNREGR